MVLLSFFILWVYVWYKTIGMAEHDGQQIVVIEQMTQTSSSLHGYFRQMTNGCLWPKVNKKEQHKIKQIKKNL